MRVELFQQLPADGVKIFIVLFLSFLIGLEREEHKAAGTHYSFGGIRTFPLIGLIGYALALLCGTQLLPFMVGFLTVASFMLLSYWHKLKGAETAGVTTEMSGLATLLVGALVCYGHFWIATTISVASLVLLDLKAALEKLASRIGTREILTFAKFLFLSAVILPVLPNHEFGSFHINPFKTWLVVVAISAVSYASYVLQKLTHGQGGIVLAALLGGVYSSTVTTVVLAKQSRTEDHPHLFAGGILMASGVMYLRLAVLLGLFNHQLFDLLVVPFLVLSVLATLAGWLWSRRADSAAKQQQHELGPKNPLELGTAFLFALIFLGMLIITQLAVAYLGRAGLNTLAAILGVADVDPFILGLTQDAGGVLAAKVAAGAILIAASSNNVAKGIYAYSLADKKTGRQSLTFLLGLALAGLTPLIWFLQ
ncbi:MAG: MgtC/SapB family protein [Acidobacteriota bacterium]|nr:MgtC/SapB family protein [Acidobacteriota bacterium]